MDSRILVCDDEDGMRRYLKKMLQSWGHQVECFSDAGAMLRFVEESDSGPDLLLLDIKMPDLDGIEALRRLRRSQPTLPVIMMTGHGTIDSAVEAMKLGAYDYLTKPFPQEKLFALVQHCLDQGRLQEENTALKREIRERCGPGPIVFESERFGAVYDLARRVADSDTNVLILGESGTGKELIAGTIHEASPRAARRFLAINCAALSETLLESQLFGHVKGAFTGAVQSSKGLLDEADGGTLFLDEVGDLSASLQAKLLRVLQEGEFIPVGSTRPRRVDVRFVAATNKNLEQEVAAGNFREDLFFRLNVIGLELPPLRERAEDIGPLADHFLQALAKKSGRRTCRLSEKALETMKNYHWPGNVRELENVLERGSILARDGVITPAELPFGITRSKPQPAAEGMPESFTLRAAERQQVLRTLRHTGWNKSRAAELLEVTRKTLDRKIKEFDLSRSDLDEAP
nr:sigma-54-dependent Fis family transcriptional regulator [Desulfuromonadales bacterium]